MNETLETLEQVIALSKSVLVWRSANGVTNVLICDKENNTKALAGTSLQDALSKYKNHE